MTQIEKHKRAEVKDIITNKKFLALAGLTLIALVSYILGNQAPTVEVISCANYASRFQVADIVEPYSTINPEVIDYIHATQNAIDESITAIPTITSTNTPLPTHTPTPSLTPSLIPTQTIEFVNSDEDTEPGSLILHLVTATSEPTAFPTPIITISPTITHTPEPLPPSFHPLLEHINIHDSIRFIEAVTYTSMGEYLSGFGYTGTFIKSGSSLDGYPLELVLTTDHVFDNNADIDALSHDKLPSITTRQYNLETGHYDHDQYLLLSCHKILLNETSVATILGLIEQKTEYAYDAANKSTSTPTVGGPCTSNAANGLGFYSPNGDTPSLHDMQMYNIPINQLENRRIRGSGIGLAYFGASGGPIIESIHENIESQSICGLVTAFDSDTNTIYFYQLPSHQDMQVITDYTFSELVNAATIFGSR